jgi:hypothetical protein
MSATKDKSKATMVLLGLCSFISYGVFHGLMGWYIFMIFSFLQEPIRWAPTPEMDAWLLGAARIGTIIGVYAGALSWLSHSIFKQSMGFARRYVLGISSPALLSSGLLTILRYPHDWRTFAIYFIPGALLGLASGLLSEARRNPWDVLFRGVGEQQRGNNPFAIITALGLRLGGLFGLLFDALQLAALSGMSESPTRLELVLWCGVFTYFGLTILIASIPSPLWIGLISGLLINVPTLILTIKSWDVPDERTFTLTYLMLWVLFIAGRLVAAQRQKVKTGGAKTAELGVG